MRMPRPLALLLTALLALSPLAAPAAPVAPGTRLDAAQAQRDLRILERALTELHPGLFRYQTPEAFAAEFAAARAATANGIEQADLFLLVTRIAASVRCGHTWTNTLNQAPAMQARLAALPVMPVHVRLLQDRLLVTASTDASVRTHDEIRSIDGRPIPALVAELLPYLRADGSSDGKRREQFNTGTQGGALDRLMPILHPPVDGVYRLVLRAPSGAEREVRVPAIGLAQRDAALAAAGVTAPDEAWRLEYRGDTAILTMPTFAFWNGGFDWERYLQDAFEDFARRGTRKLVLDLRMNEGGDDAIGRALLGYLIDREYVAPAGVRETRYERVPYILARYLDTWDFDFFDRTGQVVRTEGRNWRFINPPATPRTVPRQPHFGGKVIALIGPRMSSAGFLVARDLQRSGAATLVGEPTGGNQRGLNGGQLTWLTLPNSGIAVDIPLIATIHADAPDAPISPDVRIEARISDVIAGRDAPLLYALRR